MSTIALQKNTDLPLLTIFVALGLIFWASVAAWLAIADLFVASRAYLELGSFMSTQSNEFQAVHRVFMLAAVGKVLLIIFFYAALIASAFGLLLRTSWAWILTAYTSAFFILMPFFELVLRFRNYGRNVPIHNVAESYGFGFGLYRIFELGYYPNFFLVVIGIALAGYLFLPRIAHVTQSKTMNRTAWFCIAFLTAFLVRLALVPFF